MSAGTGSQASGRRPLRPEPDARWSARGKLTIAGIGEIAGYAWEVALSRRVSRHFGFSPKQMHEQEAASPHAPPSLPRISGAHFLTRLPQGPVTAGVPAAPAKRTAEPSRGKTKMFFQPRPK